MRGVRICFSALVKKENHLQGQQSSLFMVLIQTSHCPKFPLGLARLFAWVCESSRPIPCWVLWSDCVTAFSMQMSKAAVRDHSLGAAGRNLNCQYPSIGFCNPFPSSLTTSFPVIIPHRVPCHTCGARLEWGLPRSDPPWLSLLIGETVALGLPKGRSMRSACSLSSYSTAVCLGLCSAGGCFSLSPMS